MVAPELATVLAWEDVELVVKVAQGHVEELARGLVLEPVKSIAKVLARAHRQSINVFVIIRGCTICTSS